MSARGRREPVRTRRAKSENGRRGEGAHVYSMCQWQGVTERAGAARLGSASSAQREDTRVRSESEGSVSLTAWRGMCTPVSTLTWAGWA